MGACKMKADAIRVNKINPVLDRRKKLSDADRQQIKDSHRIGVSIRGIAAMFGVNRRLVQFILFPERQALNLKHREDRGGWKQYYDKDKWRESMAAHRDYKRKIIQEVNSK